MTKFADLALPPELLQALEVLAYTDATEVQAATLPSLLQGQDVLAQAKTGSGKTAAFGLALLAKLESQQSSLQSLVLCPTRELADQVAKELRGLARFIPNVKIVSLCGGIPVRTQMATLHHEPHIVVGTPGRIQDLLRRNALKLDALNCLVLDEADRMLDMGFIDPIREILELTPKSRSTWLFSATYPQEIRRISKEFQRQPKEVTVEDKHDSAVIEQRFFRAEPKEKIDVLMGLLAAEEPDGCLVFCNTKIDAKAVATELSLRGVVALELHGDLGQRERDETVVQFANGSCQVLVATDVAARGLDIKALPMVIAYELPNDPDVHVHRVGRTGRAGETGLACSLVSGREQGRVPKIEALLDTPLRWSDMPASSARSNLKRPSMQTLVIDAGRQDKLRPGDILGALTGVGGLTGNEVGKIDIFATRAYVAVALARIKATVQKLRDAKIKGKKFRVRIL
ncbi:MAG: ATP-dependent RNA helicase DbpA [Oceanococcus sp.]